MFDDAPKYPEWDDPFDTCFGESAVRKQERMNKDTSPDHEYPYRNDPDYWGN